MKPQNLEQVLNYRRTLSDAIKKYTHFQNFKEASNALVTHILQLNESLKHDEKMFLNTETWSPFSRKPEENIEDLNRPEIIYLGIASGEFPEKWKEGKGVTKEAKSFVMSRYNTAYPFTEKNWIEINEEAYIYFLEVLPPQKWKQHIGTDKNFSIFRMSEYQHDDFTDHFIQFNEFGFLRYFKKTEPTSKSYEEMIAELIKQIFDERNRIIDAYTQDKISTAIIAAIAQHIKIKTDDEINELKSIFNEIIHDERTILKG